MTSASWGRRRRVERPRWAWMEVDGGRGEVVCFGRVALWTSCFYRGGTWPPALSEGTAGRTGVLTGGMLL
eukprot:5363105-Pyramimonas_sp.AAC.1